MAEEERAQLQIGHKGGLIGSVEYCSRVDDSPGYAQQEEPAGEGCPEHRKWRFSGRFDRSENNLVKRKYIRYLTRTPVALFT